MTVYFVAASGSNGNNGLSWSTPKADLAAGLALANAPGDIVAIDAAGAYILSAATTFTPVANIAVVASTNPGSGTTIAPADMSTAGGYIGHSSSSYSITFAGAVSCYLRGLYLRCSGASSASITIGSVDGSDYTLDGVILQLGSQSGSRINVGVANAGYQGRVNTKNTKLRFGHTSQGLVVFSSGNHYRMSLDGTYTIPTAFITGASTSPATFFGCDFLGLNNTLVADQASKNLRFDFANCVLNASVTVLASQSVANGSGGSALLLDCSSGDTHGLFGYYDALGYVVSDTGTRLTSSVAGQSWKIVGSSNASFANPFITPPIPLFNSALASVTPYLECLRNDGTATAFSDAQVWAEFTAKTTSGWVMTSLFNDACAWGATAAAQTAGVGTGSWTIASSNSPASFKVDAGSSFTPAEEGCITARICVAGALTVYVDPVPRV